MANGAVYDDNGSVTQIHDRKLEKLEEIIEAANGKPVLIAYWFKHDLDRIQSRFKVEILTSSDSIKKWNEGKIQIAALSSIRGNGLNLQEVV
ncbi:hypothetical protein RWD45_21750 [Virgibacillus soli]|uniref:Helicase C-terminal domain-containing protein n=1 Tax=Paracerasibacillus soli TaxID=480284 RepID=A0ABU5CWC2_9BACI|nr:hypothetical protein [Virgibacillus soli]MDY0410677.1 hypothetical protein [Virgibacillus soli]